MVPEAAYEYVRCIRPRVLLASSQWQVLFIAPLSIWILLDKFHANLIYTMLQLTETDYDVNSFNFSVIYKMDFKFSLKFFGLYFAQKIQTYKINYRDVFFCLLV